jgi:hypothetical protein
MAATTDVVFEANLLTYMNNMQFGINDIVVHMGRLITSTTGEASGFNTQ